MYDHGVLHEDPVNDDGGKKMVTYNYIIYNLYTSSVTSKSMTGAINCTNIICDK